jgi:hypothetical protein
MNFLDGGWMLLIVVALWFLIYLPNWGSRNSSESKVSTKSRNSVKTTSNFSKNVPNGVSNVVIRKKNIRNIRAVFTLVLLASIAGIVYGIIASFTNLMSLTISAISLAVTTIMVSVLRSSGKKAQRKPQQTATELDAQRRRMAYLIRESALIDAKPDELFDERAWSDTALPDSLLNRRVGVIDTSQLAEIVPFESARVSAEEKKLAEEELNLILKRRRAIN